MDSVSVLMSTYNGEKYLVEQIESILGQRDVNVRLLVRDDGSADGTKSILEKYSAEGKLKWYSGNNLGAGYSFMDLIKTVEQSDFYAFSDQDDVWNEMKLITAVNQLRQYDSEQIVLYSCTAEAVTENLDRIGILNNSVPVTTFMDSVIRNNNQGCTMVFGNGLKTLLSQYTGKHLLMHDDLAMKVCLSVGGIVIKDQNAYICYRQHEQNVVGAKESCSHALKRRLIALKNQSCERSLQIRDILENYSNIIPENNKEILQKIAYYKTNKFGRLKIVLDKRFVSKNKKTTRHFKIGVLLGFF